MKMCSSSDFSQIVSSKRREIDSYINSLSDEIIMSEQDDIILNNIYEKYKIFPVIIEDEIIENRKISKSSVEFANPFYGMYPREMNEPRTFLQDAVEIICTFPFSGDPNIFYYKASTFTLGGAPELELCDGYFTISKKIPLAEAKKEDSKTKLEEGIKSSLNEIKKYIGWCNADVNKYNETLIDYAKKKLDIRKSKVSDFYNASKVFEIPITTNNSKTINTIKVERKIVPVKVNSSINSPEYSISDEAYEDIIDILKHQCSTFERTPEVYTMLKEEQLRDILLGTLNATFKGKANGECFRKKGKTDISIEYDNRSAFVAECKIWSGKQILKEALAQLQSYITWRDTKDCLIIFSRNKDFFKVLDEIKKNMPNEENYYSHKELEKNIFELKLKSINNDGQFIIIKVMVFDINNN